VLCVRRMYASNYSVREQLVLVNTSRNPMRLRLFLETPDQNDDWDRYITSDSEPNQPIEADKRAAMQQRCDLEHQGRS
jgi:hypothetical protein